MASNKSKTPGPIQVVVVLMLTVLAFYFGNRFGQVFDFNTMEITDGALATVNSIVAAPAAISTASVPMLYAIGLAITVLIVWLYTFMYAGKVAAGEIDAATATELIAAARKDYESNVPVTTSAQQAVQLRQTANPYQADPQTAYAVPEMEPEQTPIDYGQFATSTNYPHTYDVEDSSDVDMDALSGIASDVFDKQPRKKLSRKERKARAKEMKKLQKESNAKLKANAKSNKSIQKQLKDRDKELSKKNEFARYRRKTAMR